FNPADPGSWQGYLAYFGVDASALPPPIENLTVAKTFSVNSDSKTTQQGSELTILDGYEAVSVQIGGEYNYNNSSSGMNVWVGDAFFQWVNQSLKSAPTANLNV